MTVSILVVTTVAKFHEGGWITVLITSAVIALCIFIRGHYRNTKQRIKAVDAVFANTPNGTETRYPDLDPEAATAVFIVGGSRGGGLHALLWVQRMFPGHFRNFLFITAKAVDSQAYGGDDAIRQMKDSASESLSYFVDFCHSHGLASTSYLGFGTDAVEAITEISDKVRVEFPSAIFFTSKLITETENFMTRLLHNQAALALQRRLHLEGIQMVILPMKI